MVRFILLQGLGRTEHKKLKRGFETKKEAITYERNFTVKMSGSLNVLFEDYFELYKADVIGSIRLNTWMTKEHMIRTKILPFFSGMKMSEIKPVIVKKWHNVLLNIENAEGEAYKPTYLKYIHAQLSCMFNHAVKYYGLFTGAKTIGDNYTEEKNKRKNPR